MSKSDTLPVRKTESILEKIQDAENRIRARAFELFAGNGLFDRDLDNWLKAEDELILRPSIELREKDKQFKLKISVPGVEPKAMDIQATPRRDSRESGIAPRPRGERGRRAHV